MVILRFYRDIAFTLKFNQPLQVYPGVRSAGKYIFIEIDRSVASDGDDDDEADDEVKDLALYSLQVLDIFCAGL